MQTNRQLDCYAVEFVFSKRYFLLWFGNSDDVPDYYLANQDKLVTFRSMNALLKFASSENYQPNTEKVPVFDFEQAKEWVENDLFIFSETELLNVWNAFLDCIPSLSQSFRFKEAHEQHLDVYSTLCERVLSHIVLKPGASPPELTLEHKKVIRMVLQEGIILLASAIDGGT